MAQYNLKEKYAKLEAGARNPFIDLDGCPCEVDIEETTFHAFLEDQQKAAGH